MKHNDPNRARHAAEEFAKRLDETGPKHAISDAEQDVIDDAEIRRGRLPWHSESNAPQHSMSDTAFPATKHRREF